MHPQIGLVDVSTSHRPHVARNGRGEGYMGCLASGMTLEPTTTVQTGQHKRHYDFHSAVVHVHSGDCRVRVLCGQRRHPRGV